MSQLRLVVLATGDESLGHGMGLGVALQCPLQEGACQHRMSGRGMLWRQAQTLDSRDDIATGPASPVVASRWVGPAYSWQRLSMPGMERLSCVAESPSWEGWHVWAAGALGISTGQSPPALCPQPTCSPHTPDPAK